jgi:hypothetical protein
LTCKRPTGRQYRKLDGAHEAQLIAVAWSALPGGSVRWTLKYGAYQISAGWHRWTAAHPLAHRHQHAVSHLLPNHPDFAKAAIPQRRYMQINNRGRLSRLLPREASRPFREQFAQGRLPLQRRPPAFPVFEAPTLEGLDPGPFFHGLSDLLEGWHVWSECQVVAI